MLYERIPLKEYATIAKDFNPVKFDAKKWVRAAKHAGMKYLVYTTKHHDGFAMYNSACSDYNIVKCTPFAKDPLKELAEACKKEGIKLGLYYSLGRILVRSISENVNCLSSCIAHFYHGMASAHGAVVGGYLYSCCRRSCTTSYSVNT